MLIIQPSVHLIRQTETAFRTQHPEIPMTAIHADGKVHAHVVKRIIEHTRTADADMGEVLLISHRAFELVRMMHFDRPHLWHLVQDEVMAVEWCQQLDLQEHVDHVRSLFSVEPYNMGLARLLSKDAAKVKEVALNRRKDQFWATIRDVAERVDAKHWDVFVDATAWAEFLAGTRERFDVHGLMNPSLYDGFASVTVMSACFEETMMSLLWREHFGQEFLVHRGLMKHLRYERHPNGSRMKVLWAVEEAWSKRYRDVEVSLTDGAASILDVVSARAVAAVPDGAPFLWQANKDIEDDYFDNVVARGQSAIRLPFVAHGLNTYQHIHNVIVLSALNPPPSHFAFLSQFGVSSDQVRTALYRQAVYQTLSRSSIRDLECQEKVLAVVMDHETADWVAAIFPGCATGALPGADLIPAKKRPGRPRKHESDTARKASERQAQADARRLDTKRLETHLEILAGECRVDDIADEGWRDRIRADLGAAAFSDLDVGDLSGTIYLRKFSRLPLDHLRYGTSDEFISFLKEAWNREVSHKEEAGLLSPALFDPTASNETARGYGNIVAIRGVWLDVDDGSEMSPSEFATIFANWRMVIVNSHSSTVERPRYRIIIPTTRTMSRDVHQAVVRDIIGRLRRHGYFELKEVETRRRKGLRAKRHGLDMGKIVPTSLFYLPCHPADPNAAFFRDFAGPSREALDPLKIIQRRTERDGPTNESALGSTVPRGDSKTASGNPLWVVSEGSDQARSARQDRIVKAVEDWRSVAAQPGVGHAEFFKLAMTLRRCGLEPYEIQQTLWQEAAYARHPAERRAEINRLMKVPARITPRAA